MTRPRLFICLDSSRGVVTPLFLGLFRRRYQCVAQNATRSGDVCRDGPYDDYRCPSPCPSLYYIEVRIQTTLTTSYSAATLFNVAEVLDFASTTFCVGRNSLLVPWHTELGNLWLRSGVHCSKIGTVAVLAN